MFQEGFEKFHESFKDVSKKIKWCFQKVLGVSEGYLTEVQGGCFKEVLRGFQGCFKEVSRVFQGIFKVVSREFQGCFKDVLRVFQGIFKGVFRKF